MDQDETDIQADIKRTTDAIYRDRVLRARAENPIQKLMDGFQLFTAGLEITKLGVIASMGTSDEDAVQEGLRRRFERIRQVRESGFYRRG